MSKHLVTLPSLVYENRSCFIFPSKRRTSNLGIRQCFWAQTFFEQLFRSFSSGIRGDNHTHTHTLFIFTCEHTHTYLKPVSLWIHYLSGFKKHVLKGITNSPQLCSCPWHGFQSTKVKRKKLKEGKGRWGGGGKTKGKLYAAFTFGHSSGKAHCTQNSFKAARSTDRQPQPSTSHSYCCRECSLWQHLSNDCSSRVVPTITSQLEPSSTLLPITRPTGGPLLCLTEQMSRNCLCKRS